MREIRWCGGANVCIQEEGAVDSGIRNKPSQQVGDRKEWVRKDVVSRVTLKRDRYRKREVVDYDIGQGAIWWW